VCQERNDGGGSETRAEGKLPRDWPALYEPSHCRNLRATPATVCEMFLNAVSFRRRQAAVEKRGDILRGEVWVVSGHESLRVRRGAIHDETAAMPMIGMVSRVMARSSARPVATGVLAARSGHDSAGDTHETE
jgi:hypothetical protein